MTSSRGRDTPGVGTSTSCRAGVGCGSACSTWPGGGKSDSISDGERGASGPHVSRPCRNQLGRKMTFFVIKPYGGNRICCDGIIFRTVCPCVTSCFLFVCKFAGQT